MAETVRLIPLKTYNDERRGNISVLEDIPFKVKRVFCIYNVPTNQMRGGHAHKTCHQLLVAVCGAVLVKITGGLNYLLDCPDTGLYVPPLHIINIVFVNEDATLLVMASEKYDKKDYIYGSD